MGMIDDLISGSFLDVKMKYQILHNEYVKQQHRKGNTFMKLIRTKHLLQQQQLPKVLLHFLSGPHES